MEYKCLAENPNQEEVLAEIDRIPEEIERGIIVLSLGNYNLFNARREGKSIATYLLRGGEEKPAGLVFKIDKHFDWKNLKQVIGERFKEDYGIYGYEFLWKVGDDEKQEHHLLRYDAIEIRRKKSLEKWVV